jgi:hypothetical protein
MSNNMKALMRVAKGPLCVASLTCGVLYIPWGIWAALFGWSMTLILILSVLLICGLVIPMEDT